MSPLFFVQGKNHTAAIWTNCRLGEEWLTYPSVQRILDWLSSYLIPHIIISASFIDCRHAIVRIVSFDGFGYILYSTSHFNTFTHHSSPKARCSEDGDDEQPGGAGHVHRHRKAAAEWTQEDPWVRDPAGEEGHGRHCGPVAGREGTLLLCCSRCASTKAIKVTQ